MHAKKKKVNTIPWLHQRSPCPSLICINLFALISEYFSRGSVAVVHKMKAGLLTCDHKRTVKAIENHETDIREDTMS